MEQLKQLANNLRKRGFKTEIFKSGKEAAERISGTVTGYSVGMGSSMTLEKLDIINIIKAHAGSAYLHLPGKAGNEERNALTADFYLTSANAISLNGEIINIDGTGNRVAATCFGPRHLIYIIGKNKIADTLQAAMSRAKIAAVSLAKHFKRNTPCVKTGKCEDCLSPECVCSITTIHRKKPYGIDISVFLINEELGL